VSGAGEGRPGTALVRTGSPDEQAGLLLGERFLKRVAALDAAQWGRLDAAAQQLLARDPISRWRHARYHAAIAAQVPALEALFTAMHLAIDAYTGVTVAVELLVRGDRVWKDHDPTTSVTQLADTPETRQWRSLSAICERGRSRLGDASVVLSSALLALQLHRRLSPEAVRRMYAPVEPVIPLDSL